MLFYGILDEQRMSLLPLFGALKGRFYLAGGTALALQIGHRDSVDFDFFTPEPFDTTALSEELNTIFTGHTVQKTQDERDTLSVLIDGCVRASFFTYPYPLVGTTLDEPYLRIASKDDIACMKLSAITGRATEKDYVDIFFLLKEYSLEHVLKLAQKKFANIDPSLILKSLVYFDDITEEPITFTEGHEVALKDVQEFLRRSVKKFLANPAR